MNCHAKLRVLVKHSARYIGVDAGIVRDYRKKMGLWRPTATEANKAVAIQLGRAKREQWGTAKAALRTRYIGPDSSPEQHLAHYWREETLAVRALERQCSWSKHCDARPTPYYWRNVAASRKSARDRKRQRYYEERTRPEFRAMKAIRNATARIKRSVTRPYKSSELLGVTVVEARRHIEAQFAPGMTWTNHGKAWEIDHIIPLSSFDLSDEWQVIHASHYTNLRPLWKAENRAKAARFNEIDKDIYLKSRSAGSLRLAEFDRKFSAIS